jgi:hypothetical protein
MLRNVVTFLFVISLSAAIGLWSAHTAIGYKPWLGVVEASPWWALKDTSVEDRNPYVAAYILTHDTVPLGAAEGVSFRAEEDSDGNTLKTECSYILQGRTPQVRYWTLAAYDTKGRLLQRNSRNSALSSHDIVWRQDGSFRVNLSTWPMPGNWFILPDQGAFHLILRLYDPSAVTTSFSAAAPSMPSITAIGECS